MPGVCGAGLLHCTTFVHVKQCPALVPTGGLEPPALRPMKAVLCHLSYVGVEPTVGLEPTTCCLRNSCSPS